MRAFRSTIPEKAFTKLNKNGELTCLAVSPSLICIPA